MALPVPLAGVVGWPVAHSLSPLMMDNWLDATGCDGRYAAFAVEPENFDHVIGILPDMGVKGVNVTLPHKVAALKSADEATDRARMIGAANVLLFKNNGIWADNTDVLGIQTALVHHSLLDDPVLIIGAGGAARSAIYALKGLGFKHLRLINRTRARAESLAADLDQAMALYNWPDMARATAGCGLVMNATSMGLKGENPLKIDLSNLHQDAAVFDMVYTPLKTAFLASAEAQGYKIIDGLTMLIGQAVPSFHHFFGHTPAVQDIVKVRHKLIDALGL